MIVKFRKNKDVIRTYQLERLRYYYAVCKFDFEETAIAVYEGCDGVEYETSGVRLDLRFIPADMEFDVCFKFDLYFILKGRQVA